MNNDLQSLQTWLSQNEFRLLDTPLDKEVGHEAIDAVRILDLIVSKIKHGNLNAIEIGCDFVIADFKSPFGRTTKSHVFNALRSHVQYIDNERKALLAELAKKYIELPYPPREAKDLMKLIKVFGKKYTSDVVSKSLSVSSVGIKHLEYLREISK